MISMIMALFFLIIFIPVIIIAAIKKNSKRKIILNDLKQNGLLTNSNTGSGTINGTTYNFKYFPGSKNSPAYFSVFIKTNIPRQKAITIKKETAFDRFFKKIGLVLEIQTQDYEFDNKFFIQPKVPMFASSFLAEAKIRNYIKEISEMGYNQFIFKKNSLEVKSQPIDKNIKTDKQSIEKIAEYLIKIEKRIKDTPLILDETKSNIPRYLTFTLTLLLFFAGFILYFTSILYFKPFDLGKLLIHSLTYYFAISLLFVFFSFQSLKNRASSHYEWLIVMLISLFSIFFLSAGVMMYVNGKYDKSITKEFDTKILKKYYVRTKNGRNYYILIQSWRKNSEYEKLHISRKKYYSINPNKDLIKVYTKQGKLGYEWLKKFELIKSPISR